MGAWCQFDLSRLWCGSEANGEQAHLSDTHARRAILSHLPHRTHGWQVMAADEKHDAGRKPKGVAGMKKEASDTAESTPSVLGSAHLHIARIVLSSSHEKKPRPVARATCAAAAASGPCNSKLPSNSTPSGCGGSIRNYVRHVVAGR